MFRTIKSKFIILSLIVIILSIGIPVGFLLSQVRQNFENRSILMVESVIDLLIDGLNNSMMRGDQKNVQKIIEQTSKNNSINHVRIFNKDGIIKYADDSLEVGKNLNIIEPGHLENEISDISKREVYLDRATNSYKSIQPIIVEERCQTCHTENSIISYLDIDTKFTKAEIKFYTGSFHILFLGVLLIFLLTLGFYFIFNKFINIPLNNFQLALDGVEGGNLDLQLPVKGKDEFSKLHYHYNRMVNELKYSRAKINEMHFEQLQRADKMVTLGELTAAMAHDINNHSAIIMSRADYLLLEAENLSPENRNSDDLNVIMDQIEKISNITGNILKHSKKNSVTFSLVDLVQIIENSLSMLNPIIKKSGVELIQEIKVNKANIYGDANQLEQVVLNLVTNALDALPQGGKVKVVLQFNKDKEIQLLVNDNGIGIDEESIGKIFSPFYTDKSADKGTGLGLYIVHKICKEHSAIIECESKINLGTTFTITFKGGNQNV